MKNKPDSEDEAPFLDVDLKEIIIIVISVIVGALISLYINAKYGPEVIRNFAQIQSVTLADIVGTTVLYLFLIGLFIIFVIVMVMISYSLLKAYFEPVKKAYDWLKKKFPLLKKIAEGFEWDAEATYNKSPYLFKLGIFIIINVAIIWQFHSWLLSRMIVFIILGVYILIGIVYFIIKACKKTYKSQKRNLDELKKLSRHLYYEMETLQYARDRAEDASYDQNQGDKNCFVEAFSIHMRNLIEFLIFKPLRNYVRAEHFIDDRSKLKRWENYTKKNSKRLKVLYKQACNYVTHITYGGLNPWPESKSWNLHLIAGEIFDGMYLFLNLAEPKYLDKKLIDWKKQYCTPKQPENASLNIRKDI